MQDMITYFKNGAVKIPDEIKNKLGLYEEEILDIGLEKFEDGNWDIIISKRQK